MSQSRRFPLWTTRSGRAGAVQDEFNEQRPPQWSDWVAKVHSVVAQGLAVNRGRAADLERWGDALVCLEAQEHWGELDLEGHLEGLARLDAVRKKIQRPKSGWKFILLKTAHQEAINHEKRDVKRAMRRQIEPDHEFRDEHFEEAPSYVASVRGVVDSGGDRNPRSRRALARCGDALCTPFLQDRWVHLDEEGKTEVDSKLATWRNQLAAGDVWLPHWKQLFPTPEKERTRKLVQAKTTRTERRVNKLGGPAQLDEASPPIHPPWSAYTAAVERAIASAKSRNPERADKLVELHETLLSGWAQTRWLAKMDEQGREELLREVVAGLPSLLNRPGGDFDLSAWKSIFPPTPAEARKKAQAAANNRDYMERKRQAKALGVPFVPKKAGRPSEAPRRDAAAAVEEAYYLGRNASQPGPQYHPGSRADQPPISAPLRTTGTRARREDRHLAHGGPPVNPSGTATSEAGFSNPSLLALTPETPLSAAPAPPPGYVPAPAFPPRHGRPTDGSLSERFSGLSHGSPPPDLGPVAAFLAGRDGREGA